MKHSTPWLPLLQVLPECLQHLPPLSADDALSRQLDSMYEVLSDPNDDQQHRSVDQHETGYHGVVLDRLLVRVRWD